MGRIRYGARSLDELRNREVEAARAREKSAARFGHNGGANV